MQLDLELRLVLLDLELDFELHFVRHSELEVHAGRSGPWYFASPPRTRPGAAAASTANSPASADICFVHGMEHPQVRGIDPEPERSDVSWSQFLHSQAAVACDFFTVDTAMLRRYYILYFIHIPFRQVFYAGATANPTGAWTTQAARNLFLRHTDQLTDSRALVRDRGSQIVETFDEVFRTEGLRILKSPVRAPAANAFAERWIGSIRRELLDRTIIWNQRQLERVVVDYVEHYHTHRPHRSLAQRPPQPSPNPERDGPRIVKTTRCDGLMNEYRNAA